MKILFLTQYFPPETGAPQNRLFELALRLKAMGMHVEVLTAMPNYPKSEIFEGYVGKKYVKEIMDGIVVHRTAIFVSKSKSIVSRLRNYFSFVISSRRQGRKLDAFDFILCESPPLFLGYSAMSLAKKLKARLIFNVSDLWPESAEKLGLVTNRFLLNMAYRLEAKCYRRSFLVTGQTQGIVKDIRQRFPECDVYWLPNGVNLDNYQPELAQPAGFRQRYAISTHELVLFYGGILGHAQGLEVILKAAEKIPDLPVKFVLMGSGPLKEELIQMASDLKLKNVIFAEPVGRQEMAGVLKEIDVSVIPLRNLELFLGAIPSKIFEVLAMEKPILLGVDGEARHLFIDEGKTGWYFEPENSADLERIIRSIVAQPERVQQLGKNGREYVSAKFNRHHIAQDFYQYITKKIAE